MCGENPENKEIEEAKGAGDTLDSEAAKKTKNKRERLKLNKQKKRERRK